MPTTSKTRSRQAIAIFCLAYLLICFSSMTLADYIQPQMGGGSVSQTSAPMKHADIIYYNLGTPILAAGIDQSIGTPELRELTGTNEFDPAEPWSVLTGKAYNYQYGWNPAGFINLPSGASIWIEQTDASPELEVYDRSPNSLSYDPIFGTDGSSSRWKWSGSMTHNAYAVENPTERSYFANYEIYLGDTQTGDPLVGYTTTSVSFEFLFDLPLAGDYNQDGFVSAADYDTWTNQYGDYGNDLSADGNSDLIVDAADYTIWRDAMLNRPVAVATTIPEPIGQTLMALSLFLLSWNRKKKKVS